MLTVFDPLRNLTVPSVVIRLLLASLFGGVIGIERTYKRRPAGFRTHILICLGAAVTTLTSEYLFLNMHYTTDIARIGAQVVAGVGFIGAGTIVVTRKQNVRGLTTAAGLWASAIIGLAVGAGFYEGAILTTLLVLTAELALAKIEHWMINRMREVQLVVEYSRKSALDEIIACCRKEKIHLSNLVVTRKNTSSDHLLTALFTLRFPKGYSDSDIQAELLAIRGVRSVVYY